MKLVKDRAVCGPHQRPTKSKPQGTENTHMKERGGEGKGGERGKERERGERILKIFFRFISPSKKVLPLDYAGQIKNIP